jgi:hypothetical protein
LSSLKPLPKEREVGSGVKKPEEPKQQPSSPHNELSEYYKREQERHSGVFENPIRVPRPLPQNPGEQRGEAAPTQPTPAEQPEGAGGETGLSEELQQREEDYVARVNARLADSSFTEEEKQGHKERLIDILDAQNAQVARLKDLSGLKKDMQHAGFDDPVEWLILEGSVIPAPPAFGRFRRPLAWFRNERDQLYRDKVKEVVRYWREQGFL